MIKWSYHHVIWLSRCLLFCFLSCQTWRAVIVIIIAVFHFFFFYSLSAHFVCFSFIQLCCGCEHANTHTHNRRRNEKGRESLSCCSFWLSRISCINYIIKTNKLTCVSLGLRSFFEACSTCMRIYVFFQLIARDR